MRSASNRHERGTNPEQRHPVGVIGFVQANAGLMVDVSLNGAKITKLDL
ncbi:hypothetical protein [Cupriavidus sp. BIS7]|nr:hypothetical protein [Cupriavidus sp. BIS7]